MIINNVRIDLKSFGAIVIRTRDESQFLLRVGPFVSMEKSFDNFGFTPQYGLTLDSNFHMR